MISPTKEMKSGPILKKKKQAGYKPDICVLCENNHNL